MDTANVVAMVVATALLQLGTSVEFRRYDFPQGFVFGAASSAYQWEGAAMEDGKKPSTWDTFSHSRGPYNGDIACDGYHKYKEDVRLMAEMGLEAFRFSISWPRLIPNGRGSINPQGLAFYKNLVDELTSHGIEPHVTLHHYDLPQALEDEYGGWINRRIIEDFTAFADVCFREFGNAVKTWTTINEPNIYASSGYDKGDTPPGRCSQPFGEFNCSKGNSVTEPYLAVHNMLLAHASAARLYKQKYKAKQGGSIGISVCVFALSPYTNSMEDIIATQRAKDFLFGWILRPVFSGDYPEEMKRIAATKLPTFSDNESEQVKDSCDFIGVIHYMALRIKHKPLAHGERSYNTDMSVDLIGIKDYFEPGYEVNPISMEEVLEYIKQGYGNPPVYILENGESLKHTSSLNDTLRIRYLEAYIGAVLNSIRNGSNTRGYFVWSVMDMYELLYGYGSSFGLYYVDFDDPGLKRSAKLSAHWYSNFLKGMNVSSHAMEALHHKLSSPSSHGYSSQ